MEMVLPPIWDPPFGIPHLGLCDGGENILPWSVLSRQGTGEKLARIESLGDTRLSARGLLHILNAHTHTGTTWESKQSHTQHTPAITTEMPTTVPEGMGQFKVISSCPLHFIPFTLSLASLQRPRGRQQEYGGRISP